MNDIYSYRSKAYNLLNQFQLVMSPSELRTFHQKVMECGKNEFEYLISELNKKDQLVMELVKQRLENEGLLSLEEVMQRVLGFGYFQTEGFSCLCSNLNSNNKRRSSLGARANFILSFYDFLVDSDLIRIIEAHEFDNLLRNNKPFYSPLILFYRKENCERMIEMLVKNFREGVSASLKDKEQNDLFTIILMACKIQNSITKPANTSYEKLEEKSIYPFLILAYISQQTPLPSSVINWASDFGRLIGLVDDLSDYELDLLKNSPNGISDCFMKDSQGISHFEEKFIALLNRLFRTTNLTPSPIFTATINSWISSWNI
ncbi:hypothetical protein [Sporocytophaga myxococcoides]|uniref:hypothetical protein n=1 Tax=Sporocytophaga myxococcoides TaxID=153721 RepID=UPI0003F9BCF3|nr:hypothetical protein [Sporocytophaga myxococcoides]